MTQESPITLRAMRPGDRDEIARLIFRSTNHYYTTMGRPPIFQGDELSPGFIFDVYAELDPGEGLVATCDEQIVGSCFVHPRPSHISLGIMNVHPDHFGHGIARRLLSAITSRAEAEQTSVRLGFELHESRLLFALHSSWFCSVSDISRYVSRRPRAGHRRV